MNTPLKAAQLLAGLMAFSSSIVAFLILILVALFTGNFRPGNIWHCTVFAAAVVGAFLPLVGFIRFLKKPSWLAFTISLLCSSFTAFTLLLLDSPGARGLIH